MNHARKLFSAILLTVCGTMCANTFANETIDTTEFLDKAAARAITEVETGKFALQNSTHTEVLAYAQHMIDEHSSKNHDLIELAKKKNIELIDEAILQKRTRAFTLKQFSETSFDIAYARSQVATHKHIVQLFRDAATSEDADVSAFAKSNLPMLMHHLYMAQQLLATTTRSTNSTTSNVASTTVSNAKNESLGAM